MAQYSYIVFDEAVTFDFEQMILPLMARLRNANVDYTPRMAWCTNPKYDHGIYHWIKDFYLDGEGIPLDDKSNVERYFVLQNNKPLWFDRREDAELIYGSGADSGVRSFRAIKAHVSQNIPLLKSQPDYLSNLKALPDVKRRIYLEGSWTAREEEAGLFLRGMITRVEHANFKAKKRVRCFDLASQPVSTQSPNPDWTRGLLMSKDDSGVYTVEDAVSVRDRPHIVEQLIFETAKKDKELYGSVTYGYPIDPGQAGIARANEMKRKLAEIGVNCKLIRPHKSKRTRFLPFSAIAEAGYINVVMDDWNEEYFDELEEFTGLRRGERDDFVDVSSDCVYLLNMGIQLPSFHLPSDLTTGTSFGFQQSDIPSDLVQSLTAGEFT